MTDQPEATERRVDYDVMEADITRIRAMFRWYPKIQKIVSRLKTSIRRNNAKTEGHVILLRGPTRSGKSHLLGELMKDFPRQKRAIVEENGDFADRIPVVMVKVEKGSRKEVTEAIYTQLVGLHPASVLRAKYKEGEVRREIKRVGVACGLQLVILDEVHQFVNAKTGGGDTEIASLVKDLANLAVFSLLVVGTQKALAVIEADDELESRTRHYRIVPFAWTEEDVAIWRKILQAFERQFIKVFGTSSGLAEPDMAYALMVAAEGRVGHMATILEHAGHNVLADMRSGERRDLGLDEKILWEDLEEAFESWAPSRDRINPFAAANRPRREAIPALGSVPPFNPDGSGEDESAEDATAAPIVQPSRRRNGRDSLFRQ